MNKSINDRPALNISLEQDISTQDTTSEKDDSFLTPDDKAAIYARKSIKTDSHSIGSQIARGMEVINENKLILHNVYSDSESASKYPYDIRNGFKELISDMKKGKFKTIVVLKRDRLSRRFDELLKIRKMFKQYNVRVIYSSPGEFQPRDNDYFSDFVENIIMGISELEPKNTLERTANGRKVKREKGSYFKTGRIPFGFTDNVDEYNSKHKSKFILVPHKDEAPIVQKAFEAYLENNYDSSDLEDFINKKIVDPEKKLTSSRVSYMLTNPTYAGIQIKNTSINLFHQNETTKIYSINQEAVNILTDVVPIISQELFFKVALRYLNSKTIYKPKINNYLFKNLLFCSCCNKKLYLSNSYYRCSTPKCNSFKQHSLVNTLLERILYDLLDDQRINQILNDYECDYQKEIANLKTRLKNTKSRKDTLLLEFVKIKNQKSIQAELKQLIEDESNHIEQISYYEDKIESLNDIPRHLDSIKSIDTIQKVINYLCNPQNLKTSQDLLSNIIESIQIDRTGGNYEITQINYGAIQNNTE